MPPHLRARKRPLVLTCASFFEHVGGSEPNVSDAHPPFELVKKTPEAYAATLAKLGVAKVCNMAFRPTGSLGPFTLCEITAGLTKDSSCNDCKKTKRGRPARGVRASCCPCDANGVFCWYTKGSTKKGMAMSGYCKTCKAGSCTPAYHASGERFTGSLA